MEAFLQGSCWIGILLYTWIYIYIYIPYRECLCDIFCIQGHLSPHAIIALLSPGLEFALTHLEIDTSSKEHSYVKKISRSWNSPATTRAI